MATQVLIAHTGQVLEVDTADFSSLDELRDWVGRNQAIPPQHLILLTPQGKSVKNASLHVEREIYIYDIRTTQTARSPGAAKAISEIPLPRRYSGANAPNSIENVKAISSWQDLYKDRRAWSVRVLEDCERMHRLAQARFDEMDVMVKCIDAAVANLEISVKQLEPKYKELKEWVDPALQEHGTLAASLEQYMAIARNTPVSSAMAKFMTRGEVKKANPTLEDLIDLDTARKAAKLAPTAQRRFSEKAGALDQVASQMYQGLEKLIEKFDNLTKRSVLEHGDDSGQLLQDIEAVVKQIDSDYQTALSYGNSQRDLAQASKTASNHTERLVPSLKKCAKEMDDLLQYATKSRNTIASESVEYMRSITDITSLRGNVKDQINVLNQAEDDLTTFDYLRLIHQLPYMYASFMVEAIRRREWIDKVKNDSSTLANEMALFQDEEAKRRKRWQKMVGSTYGPDMDTNVVGLEVSLLGQDEPWPPMSKKDMDTFLETLKSVGVDETIVGDITQLVQELHSPTRQQNKRLKAFKNGSVHDAALGRSGLMLRGDDELLRALQEDKTKLESKLKTADSRVRRLEDLLHRQSQASRPGNLFQTPGQSTHERNGSSSSIRSPRLDGRERSSSNAEPLVRQVAQLENELREEKQRGAQLQQEVAERTAQLDESKTQVLEVNTTKKDLLENMEALKREFVDERKSLEDEIALLKARLEDTEDEIDNFGVSRENEKATYDERVHALEAELEKLYKEGQDETIKAQGQVEFLRNETRILRDQYNSTEQQLREAQDQNRALASKLGEAQESISAQSKTFRDLHVQLTGNSNVPQDASDLVEVLISHTSDLMTNRQNLESDASVLRSDLEQATKLTRELRAELEQIKGRLSAEESTATHLRESLAAEEAKSRYLEKDLEESRHELSQARACLSQGQTGSESLEKELENAEKKITTINEELASKQSQVGSLEEEVRALREKLDSQQSKLTGLGSRYETRDERSKELTQRLFSQNERMARLLERIGFAISRNDGQMVVTKVSRADKSAQNPNDSSDPGNSIRRSSTLGSKLMHDSTDLELLHWVSSPDAAIEDEKYAAFMSKLGAFDMDTFADTVYHRVKEMEHKARKWQKEARNYRDRAHTSLRDSQDKIAFKNFKEGDLALFLPTRNQQAGAWAAFNVGFPHYFLREQDTHKLRQREWLVARIVRIQERVVDLSKSLQPNADSTSIGEEYENPFQLSDGLRWYLIEAQEDKPGAPSTPGMGKSTVAGNTVEATANIHTHAVKGKGKARDSVNSIEGINKTLSKSLESRRSSSGSKKALPFAGNAAFLKSNAVASETSSLRAAAPETPSGTSPTQGGHLSGGPPPPRKPNKDEEANTGSRSTEADGSAAKQGEPSVPQGHAKLPEVREFDNLLGP